MLTKQVFSLLGAYVVLLSTALQLKTWKLTSCDLTNELARNSIPKNFLVLIVEGMAHEIIEIYIKHVHDIYNMHTYITCDIERYIYYHSGLYFNRLLFRFRELYTKRSGRKLEWSQTETISRPGLITVIMYSLAQDICSKHLPSTTTCF